MKKIICDMKDINIVEPIVTIKSRIQEKNIQELEKLAEEILKS